MDNVLMDMSMNYFEDAVNHLTGTCRYLTASLYKLLLLSCYDVFADIGLQRLHVTSDTLCSVIPFYSWSLPP